MNSKSGNDRGFTLVELAIVLIIVALLLGGMLMSLTTQRTIRATKETEAQLASIQEALLGFAATNGRLPRPATSATDGSERASNCSSEAECTGFIPWQALGVNKTDAWGKLIRYSVTPAFANNAFSLSSVSSKKVYTRDSAGNPVFLIGYATCSTTQQCAPAVIFSQGEKRWGTNDLGIAMGAGTATSLDENSNDTGSSGATAGTQFFSRPFSDNTTATGGEFDDIVAWLSPNILFNRMIAAGRLP